MPRWTPPGAGGWILITLLALGGCGDDEGGGDLSPPAAVTDLAVAGATATTVTLTWTASGDDGASGTARSYDVRYATAPLADSTWEAAVAAGGEPAPRSAGSPESFVVQGLAPATNYYFALRVADEEPNVSPPSNVVSSTTLPREGTDASWWEGFDADGLNGPVFALHVHDGKLIVGGGFTLAGRVDAQHVASWDGSLWSALGRGVNSEVWAIETFDGDLVAGGSFTVAGETPAAYVARWDGTEWLPLGGGMNGSVWALTVWNGELVAGGEFTEVDGVEASYLARWNGAQWHPIHGLEDRVYALTSYPGGLIVGGRFERAGGLDVHQIARWDGVQWSPLASGMFVVPPPASVSALAVRDADLLAGGYFTSAGDVAVSNLARWDGVAWSPMGAGASDFVLALGTYRGAWVAGGMFSSSGDVAMACVARFDGTLWRPLASGITGTHPSVYAVAEYGGALYVGGLFESAGGKPSYHIARWTD